MDATQITALERQMLEEHKKDLEALARLKRFLPTNGSAPTVDERQMALPVLGRLDEDLDEAPVKSLRGTIERIVNADPSVRWTTQKMVFHLQGIRFPLRAKKPIYSVGQSMQILANRGAIRLVRRGVGAAPNIYRGKSNNEQITETEGHSVGGENTEPKLAR